MRNINESRAWLENLDTVTETFEKQLARLNGKTVLITGATGLICSAFADLILRYDAARNGSVRVICAGRSRSRFEERFRNYLSDPRLFFLPYDASDDLPAAEITEENLPENVRPDYIIHGAGNATPDRIMKEPAETMLSNFQGMKRWLEYAASARNANVRILYISSSEIYGRKEGMEPYKEDEYGYIDLMNPRNSYSISKRAAETLCISYAAEYHTDAVIVRPGHIYGPTAAPSDDRVSSAFGFAAARGEELVLNSAGLQLRSYCHCLDCASAMLSVLLDGESGSAYNISNPESVITIREMAAYLADAGNVQLRFAHTEDSGSGKYTPMSNSSLNSERLESLGWRGCFPPEKGFADTVTVLREMLEN